MDINLYKKLDREALKISKNTQVDWVSNDYFVSCGNFSILNCAVFVCKWFPLSPTNSAPPCGFDIHVLHTNA